MVKSTSGTYVDAFCNIVCDTRVITLELYGPVTDIPGLLLHIVILDPAHA